jgi:hypothetical protein
MRPFAAWGFDRRFELSDRWNLAFHQVTNRQMLEILLRRPAANANNVTSFERGSRRKGNKLF